MRQPATTFHPNRLRNHACRGLSMIEALCACAVTMVALGASVGGMSQWILGQRLQSAAEELETTIHLARSTALLQSRTVRLVIQPLAEGSSCTLIHTGAEDACECGSEGTAVCDGSAEVVHQSRQDARSGVRITTNAMSLSFSAGRGMVTPTATLKLADTKGRVLHQVVNVMGRVRTCSPVTGLAGVRPC